MTAPAAEGMKQGVLYTGISWNTKATVYTSTAPATQRMPHSSPLEAR